MPDSSNWRGRGGGRPGGQPSLNISGGAGRGGGRGGAQPSLEISGGAGRGGGRPGAQPSLEISGGAGRGGGRGGAQPNVEVSGGAGRGGGRGGAQPSLDPRNDYGGSSTRFSKIDDATGNFRARSSLKANGGDQSPRVADPEGNFLFELQIGGSTVAHFQEVSGFKSTTEIVEIAEGGLNQRVHKVPGQSRWENLTLRYGVCKDTTLLKWRQEILQDGLGPSMRKNGSIILKTLDGQAVRVYEFQMGWPVSWEGPSLNANSAELAVESLEIAHEGITVRDS